MPFSVVELGATFRTDMVTPDAELHQREAVFQTQNKPVVPVFGISVENGTFRVKGP